MWPYVRVECPTTVDVDADGTGGMEGVVGTVV